MYCEAGDRPTFYESILVPTDGSEGAEGAVDRALDLATLLNADLLFLRVVDTEQFSADKPEDDVEELFDGIEAEAETDVGAYAERVVEAGVDYVETEVRRGVPHAEIVDYSAHEDAELTVMGASGEPGSRPGDIGGVTEAVTTSVDEPVMVV